MANALIVSELQNPATYGLNGITRVYTNPGGISRSDPVALIAIEGNAALFRQNDDILVYRASIMPDEFFTVLTQPALSSLSATEREDYAAFVVPMLTDEIKFPELLLKSLVDDIFSNGTTDPSVRSAYDSLIQENQSIAKILGIRASDNDVQEAMQQLGWVAES